jgi:hypothetical protein
LLDAKRLAVGVRSVFQNEVLTIRTVLLRAVPGAFIAALLLKRGVTISSVVEVKSAVTLLFLTSCIPGPFTFLEIFDLDFEKLS